MAIFRFVRGKVYFKKLLFGLIQLISSTRPNATSDPTDDLN